MSFKSKKKLFNKSSLSLYFFLLCFLFIAFFLYSGISGQFIFPFSFDSSSQDSYEQRSYRFEDFGLGDSQGPNTRSGGGGRERRDGTYQYPPAGAIPPRVPVIPTPIPRDVDPNNYCTIAMKDACDTAIAGANAENLEACKELCRDTTIAKGDPPVAIACPDGKLDCHCPNDTTKVKESKKKCTATTAVTCTCVCTGCPE